MHIQNPKLTKSESKITHKLQKLTVPPHVVRSHHIDLHSLIHVDVTYGLSDDVVKGRLGQGDLVSYLGELVKGQLPFVH